jgi:hypothetical protein
MESVLQHHHVLKVFALPDTTPEKEDSKDEQNNNINSNATTMIQLVRKGEGRDRMSLPNLVSKQQDSKIQNEKELSLHRPILVRDTPESIGMKIPKGGDSSSTTSTSNNNSGQKSSAKNNNNGGSPKKRKRKATSAPFSVRDVANVVGHSSPVQMINVLKQQVDEDVSDWTFHDMVEYFEDKERESRNNAMHLPPEHQQFGHNENINDKALETATETPASPTPNSPTPFPIASTSSIASTTVSMSLISPTTGRRRRKAAIRSEECFGSIIHDEGSSGLASTRILNQISYEFSGTPLHAMVRSPTIVRDIDWIDHAWPVGRKPRQNIPWCNRGIHQQGSSTHRMSNGSDKSSSSSIDNSNDNNKTSKKAHKGKNSTEYPVVQYYCLTSAAGSYTDFHIDFGGSSVWYHVIRGQKIFVVSPPTRQNLRVYEEWLCHPDQAKIFLPDMMKERACPDVHCYSTSNLFSSASSVSTHSSASTAATYGSGSAAAALGDLADEMAFFRNSLQNALSTNKNALRFTLNEGETLVLPAGWIHAVYTPVDSLVFGGNFLHGLDMQMQLAVNTMEARSRVLDQYRFPFFAALQMYAGGMYLQRMRATRKVGILPKHKSASDDYETGAESSDPQVEEQKQKEQQQGQQKEQNNQQKQEPEQCQREEINRKLEQENSYSNTSISPREIEELPMLINALEYWWLSEQDAEENVNYRTKEQFMGTVPVGASRTLKPVTSNSSFRDAALYVAKENGCESVEDFIASLRNEYARVANEQWGSCRVAPSDDPNGNYGPSSSLPVPLSTIPIAIGKPKKKKATLESKKKNEKPRHKKSRKRSGSKTNMDDPLEVVLSKTVREYLASIQITTAAQLLMARTTDVAEKLPEWRKQKGMAELKGRAGAVASVSVWKRKVRLQAALVGAKKLAQLNEGTNMKPLGLRET